MNRYHIALDKPLPRESKILKPLLRKLKRKKNSGKKDAIRGQDSSAFIANVNAVRNALRQDSSNSLSQIQGETELPGAAQSLFGVTGIQGGLTGAAQSLFFQGSSSEAIRIDPNTGRVGIGSPPPDTPLHIQGEGSGLRVQGSSEGTGLQVRASDPADPAFFSTGDSVVTPSVPVSQFFTLTGPNGLRIMIPLRRLVLDMCVAEDDFERCTLVMRMNLNQANSMQADINDAKERLGLSGNE